MKTQLIAISYTDGTLGVMTFVLEGNGVSKRELTAETFAEEILRGNSPRKIATWRPIQSSELPASREFRNAWMDNGTAIEHDMEKVRAIHLQRLRAARVLELERLDREWMRATGQGKSAEAAEVELKRQQLRDMPQLLARQLDAARTPDEVSSISLASFPSEVVVASEPTTRPSRAKSPQSPSSHAKMNAAAKKTARKLKA